MYLKGTLVWVVVMFVVCFVASAGLAASKGPEVSTRGYSIFDGTMADMTYVQIEKAAREKAIVLFPVALMEEHGPHMPIGVDTYGAYINAKMIKVELEKKGIQAVIAPPFYAGMNNVTSSFPGSFTVREETMISLIWDIMNSLKRWGFEKVFIINHHNDADHNRVLTTAIQKSRLETGIRLYWILDDFLAKRFGFTGKEPYMLLYKAPPAPPSKYVEVHAGGAETSFMMYYFTDLVDMDVWKTLKSTDLTGQDLMVWRRGWEDAKKVTPQGIFGDPTAASPDRGKNSVEAYGKTAAELIEIFLKGQYQPPDMK